MNGSDIHEECIFGHYDVTVAMYYNEHLILYFQGTSQVQPIMFMTSVTLLLCFCGNMVIGKLIPF